MNYAQIIDCNAALAEVYHERERQHAKWGEQDLPDGTGEVLYAGDFDTAGRQCDEMRGVVNTRMSMGIQTHLDILLEEVFEANAETDPARLRAELIQVAACAVQWIECIDRRTRG